MKRLSWPASSAGWKMGDDGDGPQRPCEIQFALSAQSLRLPRMPRREAPESPLTPRSQVLTFPMLFSASSSASPRQNHTLGFPTPFHHGLVRSLKSQVLPTPPPHPLWYIDFKPKNHIQHQRTERKMSGELNQR